MYEDRMLKLLVALKIFALMPGGGGFAKASELWFYSGLAESTTYRYINKLKKQGFLEVGGYSLRKTMARQFRITSKGSDWLAARGELPALERL